MKPFSTRALLFFILTMSFFCSDAQNVFFKDVSEGSFRGIAQKRVIIPTKYRTVNLNSARLSSFFRSLPSEKDISDRNTAPVIDIPMPNGTFARFHVWESSVMATELANANPGIRTFTGQGIDDSTATIKLDWSEFGFHAMILSAVTGSVYIDPYDQQTVTNYISYYKADYKKKDTFIEEEPLKNPGNRNLAAPGRVLAGVCIGSQLRTYRLAIACTPEYAIASTGLANPTKAQTLARIVVNVNRVNGVYEKELSIRMVLIAAENAVIFIPSGTDPFTGNDDANVLIEESQTVINANIGAANYDIGHTFSAPASGSTGYAGLGVVCVDDSKANGITGSSTPVGDPYNIDFVAHEMGHQFGANHTFNSENGSCGGNGSFGSNSEPGSGSTVMAYAGICGSDNLQSNSDAYFNAISVDEITAYTISGAGSSCAVITSTGNLPPVVNAGADYTIPKSTPFRLIGTGTDPNSEVLTYSWEQVDVGGSFGSWNSPSDDAPLFRSFVPVSTPARFFPKLADVNSNATTIGEILPSYGRTMHFRLTARDNHAGGGGVCFDENAITVSGTAGPFLVTYPNASGITWFVNEFRTIAWDPAGTMAAPINCSNVRIELSTDGGLTYAVTLVASTPNDGYEEIQVPNNLTSAARIRVSSVGNVFYDISNINFAIQNSPTSEFVFNRPSLTSCSGNTAAVTLKTAAFSGFATAISLSATGNPVGTTVSFSPGPLIPGGNTTVTLSNTGTLAAGVYNITITGIAGAVTKSRVIPIVIKTPVVMLSTPVNAATGVSTLPSFNWTAVPSATYTLEISTNNTFTSIVQSQSNIINHPIVLSSTLNENTEYYWRVIMVNSCGSSTSATGVFKTGIPTCESSSDVPVEIPANGMPTVTSTITIPPVHGSTITDLNVVGLTGTHSFVNDLTVSLTSPAGTTVVLFDAICSENGDEDFNLNLDDEAAPAITCPATGNQTAKPQNPLSAFDGQNSAGVWTLTIVDNEDQDGGSLEGWGLSFNNLNCGYKSTSISSQLCAPVSSTSLTSDLTGSIYVWQLNTGSGFANISNNANYSGVSTNTLQITNAPSAWTGFQYRCLVDGTPGNVFTLGFKNYWTGSVSNLWGNASNWSCNVVPDANTDVIINSGTVMVNVNSSCRSITANPGASVTVNSGFKLSVMH